MCKEACENEAMPNYECSTCDYCDKNRKQGNKVRCIRFSKFVEGLSICEEFTNKEYEEARQKVNRMIESRWFNGK